jgi:CheY-like chemotaxis protein
MAEESEEQQRKLSHSDNSSITPIVVTDLETEPPLILFAEDNQANIDTISDYLSGRGYRLVLANNGQDVISIAKEQKPDLILMDIQMPQIDGLEATRQIRTDSELANIPIIALTALAMSGDREKCIEAGASEYLTKPVRLKQLTHAIEQLLNR